MAIWYTRTYIYLANYMQQCPSWECNGHSSNQEITSLLWNPKVIVMCSQHPTTETYSGEIN
jgi:hypothetical protein